MSGQGWTSAINFATASRVCSGAKLLRLRQAAIHPGLLDTGRVAEPSAKLEMLLPRVLEVIEEGHKTLVFSQFTGMLAILRQHLDREGVPYEYLDGKTHDRQA